MRDCYYERDTGIGDCPIVTNFVSPLHELFFLAQDIIVPITFPWGENYFVHIHILTKIFESLKVITL